MDCPHRNGAVLRLIPAGAYGGYDDEYERVPGTDPRYASIPLVVVGGNAERATRWFVDGKSLAGPRWTLRPGSHVIAARSSTGASDSVRITVR